MGEITNGKDTGATGDDASKTPPGADPVAEAHILEEHVIPAQPAPKAPAVPVEAPLPPMAPMSELKNIPSIPRPIPTTPPQAPISAPPPLIPTPIPVTPPQTPPPAPAKGLIASILESVKLPERKTSAEPKTLQTFDTSLEVSSKTDAEKAAARDAVLQNARAITRTVLPPKEKTSDDVRPLHTLKDDLQEVVRDQKISLVRAVALEEEKRHQTVTGETPAMKAGRDKRTRFGLFLAAAFFLLGTLAIGAVLYIMSERTSKATAPTVAQILFSEQSVPMAVNSLAPADVRREIGNARGNSLTLGAILQITPVTQSGAGSDAAMVPLTFGEFLDAIGARAPDELPRALTDVFFLGLHTVDENAPLMVIPVTSYERAFAAMLEWEKAMNTDLSPMFTAVPPQTAGPDGLPVERRFEDTVMRNYDVRALKDESGVIQLYYSFPTRNILIIAESPYSFGEILSRLRADRRL